VIFSGHYDHLGVGKPLKKIQFTMALTMMQLEQLL
jgi:hypothetical protein